MGLGPDLGQCLSVILPCSVKGRLAWALSPLARLPPGTTASKEPGCPHPLPHLEQGKRRVVGKAWDLRTLSNKGL